MYNSMYCGGTAGFCLASYVDVSPGGQRSFAFCASLLLSKLIFIVIVFIVCPQIIIILLIYYYYLLNFVSAPSAVSAAAHHYPHLPSSCVVCITLFLVQDDQMYLLNSSASALVDYNSAFLKEKCIIRNIPINVKFTFCRALLFLLSSHMSLSQ